MRSFSTHGFIPKRKASNGHEHLSYGVFIGAGVAVVLSGLILDEAINSSLLKIPIFGTIYSWQKVFFYVGIPGFLLAGVIITIQEPQRTGLVAKPNKQKDTVSFAAFFKHLKTHSKTFTLFFMALSFLVMMIFAKNVWAPTFLIRHFSWTPREVGLNYGTFYIVSSILGILAGGRFAQYLAGRGHADANLRVTLYNISMLIPTCIGYTLVPDIRTSLPLLICTTFWDSFHVGGIYAALQEIVPNEMRGKAVALQILLVNLIGAGLGPLCVALMTDYGFRNPDSLKYSLAICLPLMLIISLFLFGKSLKYFRETKAKLSISHG